MRFPDDMDVVVGHPGVVKELPGDHGVVEVLDIPHQRARVAAPVVLVQLVVHVEVLLLVVEPSLVRVAHTRVGSGGQRHRIRLVRHVGNAQARLVGAETHLLALVFGVGTAIDDAHRVVRVSGVELSGGRVGEAPHELRIRGRPDVDHVQAAAAGVVASAASHRVGVAGPLVDHDVVGAEDPGVRGGGGEGLGRPARAPQLREVKDLHAIVRPVGHDECVVPGRP